MEWNRRKWPLNVLPMYVFYSQPCEVPKHSGIEVSCQTTIGESRDALNPQKELEVSTDLIASLLGQDFLENRNGMCMLRSDLVLEDLNNICIVKQANTRPARVL